MTREMTGLYVLNVKLIDPLGHIIVEFAEDVSEGWITIVHGISCLYINFEALKLQII